MTIEGTLTTALGALESGRSAFVQDETGGIGLYLDATVVSPLPAGTTVRLAGTLDSRFAQRVIRVDEAAIETTGVTGLPATLEIATGRRRRGDRRVARDHRGDRRRRSGRAE